MKIKVSSPGKIHLIGEHAVVYGKSAVLAAINKRCFVMLTPRKDKKIKIISKQLKRSKFPSLAVSKALSYYKNPKASGFTLEINCEIPIGCGLGSSAAIAVSVAGAITLFLKKPFDKKIINEIAFEIEKIQHGNPSGGDNTASCYGGLIAYRKSLTARRPRVESDARRSLVQSSKLVPSSLSESRRSEFKKNPNISMPTFSSLSSGPARVSLLNNFYIINSGTPKESTKIMVEHVAQLYKKNPEVVDKFLKDQEKLANTLIKSLKANKSSVAQIIKSAQGNLEKIGVVSAFAKKVIRAIEKAGGAAKICGGGGIKKGTGVLLVYHKNKKVITEIAASFNLPYNEIRLGEEGLKIE
ncbi:MAG TPA: hypothetical protein VLF68_02965 [Candidatus Saccharimonadales bacterium]|nr:hypothetical protein [Candidatus Saccharimonadales bacterium]